MAYFFGKRDWVKTICTTLTKVKTLLKSPKVSSLCSFSCCLSMAYILKFACFIMPPPTTFKSSPSSFLFLLPLSYQPAKNPSYMSADLQIFTDCQRLQRSAQLGTLSARGRFFGGLNCLFCGFST